MNTINPHCTRCGGILPEWMKLNRHHAGFSFHRICCCQQYRRLFNVCANANTDMYILVENIPSCDRFLVNGECHRLVTGILNSIPPEGSLYEGEMVCPPGAPCSGFCIQMGSSGSFEAPCTGQLRIIMNDDNPGDNIGYWTVVWNDPDTGSEVLLVPGDPTFVFNNPIVSLTKGATYSWTASGCIFHRPASSGGPDSVDPDGREYINSEECDSAVTNGPNAVGSLGGYPCSGSGIMRYSLVGRLSLAS